METKPERIRELRLSGISLQDAKRLVERQDLDVDIRNAKTPEDFRSILWALNARLR